MQGPSSWICDQGLHDNRHWCNRIQVRSRRVPCLANCPLPLVPYVPAQPTPRSVDSFEVSWVESHPYPSQIVPLQIGQYAATPIRVGRIRRNPRGTLPSSTKLSLPAWTRVPLGGPSLYPLRLPRSGPRVGTDHRQQQGIE